jgi:hypothetical protein
MALGAISEDAPTPPSKQGPSLFSRLDAGVAQGPFSKGLPGKSIRIGLPSSPKSTVNRSNSQEKTKELARDRSDSNARTPSPINDTLAALNGRRPSDAYADIAASGPFGIRSPWDQKPLPKPVENTDPPLHTRKESDISHRRESSNPSLGAGFQDTTSTYKPWWLKDSSDEKPLPDPAKRDSEQRRSWDRPLPPLTGPLRSIEESPQSRPKTANPESDKTRKDRLDRVDPAIQFGLEEIKPYSARTDNNTTNHLYSSSNPEPPSLYNSSRNLDRAHNYNNSYDNPFSANYSNNLNHNKTPSQDNDNTPTYNHRQRDYNQHSHQHSQQSNGAFSSSSSHLFHPSPAPSSETSPDRHHHNYHNHRNNSNSSNTHLPLRTQGSSATKHTCRGCSLVIHGRSLVDSSRRLTGRYHKECFVCTDCRAPFPSGDFYVLDNLPYCAYDYHRRNKSLCQGCGIGVEGSYLQTEGNAEGENKLWHLECFKCNKCNCVLNGEYWEVDGKALCAKDAFPGGFGSSNNRVEEERDGLAPLAGFGNNPNTRNPERRRTKLFMGGAGLSSSGGMGGGYGAAPSNRFGGPGSNNMNNNMNAGGYGRDVNPFGGSSYGRNDSDYNVPLASQRRW